MDPHNQFCQNPHCSARGRRGEGNVRIFSRKEQRHQCTTCHRTCTATKGTPFYRLHKTADLMLLVVTLLGHGCPVQAIVAAFGLDERTVSAWHARTGTHCRLVHAHVVQHGQVDLQHVQADELWVKLEGKRVWTALSLAVPARLWLGGVVSATRDLLLITAVVQMIHACARRLDILVCVDGLVSYVTAVRRVFRHAVHTGQRGRPRLVQEWGLLLGQVVKQYARRRVVSVRRRGVCEAIVSVLRATGGGTDINTDYIERLNATFRATLVPLVRWGQAIAHREAVLTAGMYLVGCA